MGSIDAWRHHGPITGKSPDRTRKFLRAFSAVDGPGRALYDVCVVIEFSPYRLDPRAGRLWRGDRPIALRPKAWALLCYLAERPGVLVTKDELQAAVWGDTVVSDDTLTRTLGELRQALRDDAHAPRVIETVHRRGVRFIARLQGTGEAGPGLDPRGHAEPVSGPEPPAGTLVGRDPELAILQASFRQASAGQRQVVFIHGEPGIGKTAVVEAFLRALQASPDGVLVGYGQCVEQLGEREPYMPALEALERLSQGPAGERLRAALRAVAPSWLAQMPSLQMPADAERLRRARADAAPNRMLREFASLVETVSVEHPLILVLEDLHWSDQGTVDLLSVLAQRPERARAMLVGTYRAAQAAVLGHPIAQVLATLRGRRRYTDIALEYLSRTDVAAYVQRRFDGSRVADDVVTLVHTHTDGNPLFMVTLVDHLLARGWLTEDGGVWGLTADWVTIDKEVPDDLRQLIETELRMATRAERAMLDAASVVGVAFDTPAVAAGLDTDLGSVEPLCDRLSSSHRWLRHLRRGQWPDGALADHYIFTHALYQRVLYDRLAPTWRATLHQRIGERLEAGYAGRAAEMSGELARHFQRSQDRPRAVAYLEETARRAYDRCAYRDAVACVEPALDLLRGLPETPDRARDELRLRQLYSVVLAQTAGYVADALFENLTRTRILCEQIADPAALFDVRYAFAMLYASRGDCATAEQIGHELLQLAEGLETSAVLRAHYVCGAAALWSGNLRAAEQPFGHVLSSAAAPEAADAPYGVDLVITARSLEGLRRWLVGDPDRARAVQQEALALADRVGRPFSIAHAVTFSAILFLLDGRWAEAAQLAARAVDLSEEYGFPRWQGTARVLHGRTLVEQGDGERGLAEIRGGLDELRPTGLRLGNSLLFSVFAGACLRVSHVDEGLATVDTGLTHCRETTE